MMDKIKLAIAPWLAYIKVGALLLLFGGGVWLGFTLDPDMDCGQLDAETATELATCKVANAAYEELEKARSLLITNEQAGFQNRMANEEKAAVTREKTLEAQLAAVRKELEAAKADPKCADLMELEVCEAITIPLQPR